MIPYEIFSQTVAKRVLKAGSHAIKRLPKAHVFSIEGWIPPHCVGRCQSVRSLFSLTEQCGWMTMISMSAPVKDFRGHELEEEGQNIDFGRGQLRGIGLLHLNAFHLHYLYRNKRNVTCCHSTSTLDNSIIEQTRRVGPSACT